MAGKTADRGEQLLAPRGIAGHTLGRRNHVQRLGERAQVVNDRLNLGFGSKDRVRVKLVRAVRKIVFLAEEMRHPRRWAEVAGILHPALHEALAQLFGYVRQVCADSARIGKAFDVMTVDAADGRKEVAPFDDIVGRLKRDRLVALEVVDLLVALLAARRRVLRREHRPLPEFLNEMESGQRHAQLGRVVLLFPRMLLGLVLRRVRSEDEVSILSRPLVTDGASDLGHGVRRVRGDVQVESRMSSNLLAEVDPGPALTDQVSVHRRGDGRGVGLALRLGHVLPGDALVRIGRRDGRLAPQNALGSAHDRVHDLAACQVAGLSEALSDVVAGQCGTFNLVEEGIRGADEGADELRPLIVVHFGNVFVDEFLVIGRLTEGDEQILGE